MKQNRVLQIPNSGAETMGTYSCHAINDAGNLTASLTLSLLGKKLKCLIINENDLGNKYFFK